MKHYEAPPAKKTKKAVLFFEVEILDARTREKLCFLDKVEPHATVAEIKGLFTKAHPQWYPARQSLRLDPKGRSLKDEDVLQSLPVGTTATFYFRDLGAQISWVTVFLTEYAGPLLIYLLFYFRVPFLYGPRYDFTASRHPVVHLACGCHSFHYVKRLLETLFVHRFSHGTMPLRNIFKNCTYYWGFAAWMAYYINHPLYTPPAYGDEQVKLALAVFLFCQLGNFSIHVALRNLRPAGSKTRKIPYPTRNPFTWLFLLVSCPNYTYEWPSSRWWASCRWPSGRRASTAATCGSSATTPRCAPPSSPSCCDTGDSPRGHPTTPPPPAGTPRDTPPSAGTPCSPSSPSCCDTRDSPRHPPPCGDVLTCPCHPPPSCAEPWGHPDLSLSPLAPSCAEPWGHPDLSLSPPPHPVLSLGDSAGTPW
ncbi:very-long-chain enoyl-CoA reductase isoform X2 [Calonectris borealis]|uniref:very-long-chain enoyl-CoA reductase isoform X2 n=1 Tax=Calonectris borealis TaxID=1323832 RepID=UPI003F4C9B55